MSGAGRVWCAVSAGHERGPGPRGLARRMRSAQRTGSRNRSTARSAILRAAFDPLVHRLAEVEPDEDARDSVLLGRLGEAGVAAQDRRPVDACLPGRQRQAARREGDVVGAEEALQNPGTCATLDRVCRVVVRDRRRRHQRGPGRVGARLRVAVGVRAADRGDRPPVVVVVLGVEGADVAVGKGHVEQGEQPRLLPRIEPGRGGDGSCDPVPLQRRALDPEQGDLGLLGGARAGSGDAVATQSLHLVEVGGVPLAGHRVGRTGTELRAVPEHERRDRSPARRERERAVGGEAPLARERALRVCGVEQRRVGTVRGAQAEDGRGGGLSQVDAPRLGPAVGNGARAVV